jgi:hypothetical protein
MKTIFTAGLAILLLAVPGFAQKVNIDYDEAADFAALQTYAWREGTAIPNPLMHQRVVAAVEYHLSMMGYEKVDSNPDFYVTYHASTKEEQRITTSSFGYGGGRRWRRYGGVGMGTSTSQVHTSLKGELLVDIWNAKEKALMWRGIASNTLSDKPEKNEKKINKSVEKMFDKFPPKGK